MKTKNKLLIILSLIILNAGCKKQELQDQNTTQRNSLSQNVKAWLETQAVSSGSQKFLLDGKLIDIPQKIHWATTLSTVDNRICITSVNFNSGDGTNQAISKYLLTKQDESGNVKEGSYYIVFWGKKPGEFPQSPDQLGNLLEGKMIPEDFKGSVIRYDLNHNVVSSKHYESGKSNGKTDILILRKSKNQMAIGNTAPPPEGCSYISIDWFWQVYENGVLVYEVYIYSSEILYCPNGGGGGASGSGNPIEQCNQQFNALVNSASVSNISEGKILLYETNEERAHTYKWKCLTSPGGWYVRSYDVGTQERGASTNWEWHWKSIVHSDIALIGMPIGGTVENNGPGTGTVTYMGNINAHYSLNFAMKYTPGCASLGITLPSYTVEYTASTIFSVFPYVGGPQ